MPVDQDTKFGILFTFYKFCVKICSFEITWPTLLFLGCLHLIVTVYKLLNFDQIWFEGKDNRNYKEKRKKYWQKLAFSYMGAEFEKGRNLLAETSGGQIRKGPKPLATVIFSWRKLI